jgi:hypothetical protein
MSNANFMEKLLDGVEVEWRTLGGNIGWWYKQYYTI